MTWHRIRLELARTPDFPTGSSAHAYMLYVPLGGDGKTDFAALEREPERAYVRRYWPGEPDQSAELIRRDDGQWAFSYEPGDEDDETLFSLATHPLNVGDFVTITETDGAVLPFRIVSSHEA